MSIDLDSFYEEEEDIYNYQYEDVDSDIFSPKDMSANDAFIYCMNEKGHVDLDYMEAISGIDIDELIEQLSGKAIYPDPEIYDKTKDYIHCFTTSYQYLRGNLIKKYEKAKELQDKYGLFDDTLNLLASAQPDKIEPEDIHMNLGSTWIPPKYISMFIHRLLDTLVPPRIEYNDYLGRWTLEFPTDPNYVKNFYEYGTLCKSAVSIIKHALHANPVKVYDQIPRTDGREGFDSVLNKQETLAAQQKMKLVQDAWQDFVHGNPEIEEHLQEVYMEAYGYSLSRYDGSFLQLPGLNPKVKPYNHQLDAIARIVLNRNILLAHEVGSGKTMEYMCGVHELIRMKLGNKALIVLPNTTFDSAVNTYKELYEEDSILAVYPKKHFTPAQRRATLDKIKSDEYQVIFMTYSSFDKLTLSGEYLLKKKEQRLMECRSQLNNAKIYATRRALEAEMKRLKKSVEKYKEQMDCSDTACFEMLGIDILAVDEAHNYKNISLDNTDNSIVGVHSAGSKKADNMLEKVEYIQSINGHVIFATGTPITNSMADLYVLQRYLQPEEMRLCNIYHFNEWISTFASQTHTFEVDIDSKNYRYTTRFSKFHNLPELMAMFSDICDFYQIPSGELGLPEFDGYTNVQVHKSEEQKVYIDELAKRTEAIRKHQIRRNEDNLLLITVDGRKCALDIRLVNPKANVSSETTKAGVCAVQMAKLYFENPGTTQIAFSDIGTPKDGFNIYNELKKELIGHGIPEGEIKFIHEAKTEAQRNRLEKQFNAGEIRILIGSTMKLGMGANVQEKLLAIHHLDVPWRPADMVQREGRIIRQGNTNRKVHVYRYCTEASFDAYTWQILENKQRFIAQFLSGTLSSVHRDESDCAETVLCYAEIKALAIGNPLIKERVEVANELEQVKIHYRQKHKELVSLKELLDSLPRRITQKKIMISNARSDYDFYRSKKKSISLEEREMFGEELLYALEHNVMRENDRLFSVYQEFDVILPKHMKEKKPFIVLKRKNSNSYQIKMDGDKALGCGKRIDYFLDHLEENTINEYQKELEDLYKQKKNAELSLEGGNEFEKEVDRLTEKLAKIDERLKEDELS